MITALTAGSITLLFVAINSFLYEQPVTGIDSVTLYFVIATWINVLKK